MEGGYTNHFIEFHGRMRYENVLLLLLGGGKIAHELFIF